MTGDSAQINRDGVWREVAGRIRRHRASGRGHLMTEDSVRMETILALGDAGVGANRLVVEYLAPSLAGGKVDLVVDAPDGDVIELKYPRDSRTKFSPDTMTMGEMVRDFLRVAGMPTRGRWVVQAVNPRFERYLVGLDPRHQLRWAVTEGSVLELHPEVLRGLPKTAREAVRDVGTAAVMGMMVVGHCVAAVPIDVDLSLYAYLVDSPSEPTPLPPRRVDFSRRSCPAG